ncbi:MAG: LytTR family transcriptional regulator DNA-binding domain-containing protein [bacterium]|nr:LytTR family transcriptional regulator DNA-binding domain-containing protein [bacterium]
MNCLRYIFLILSVLWLCDSQAQEHFQQFTKSDGLPSNEIYDIHQDINGLIWIASDRGITSFNGSYFKTYDVADGLPDHVVFEFFEQKDGTIWCTTYSNQLFYFHPNQLTFTAYKYNHLLKELPKSDQRDLVIMPDSSIKFRFGKRYGYCHVSKRGELSMIDSESGAFGYGLLTDKEGYFYCTNIKASQAHSNDPILTSKIQIQSPYNIARNKNSILVAGIDYMQFFKDGKLIKEEYYHDAVPLKAGLDKDVFWIGNSTNGVFCLNENGEVVNHYAKGVASTCYFEDMDGNVWIGTQATGVMMYPNGLIHSLSDSRSKRISRLSINSKKELVFETNDGFTYIYSGSNCELIHRSSKFVNSVGQLYNSGKYVNFRFLTTSPTRTVSIYRYSDDLDAPPITVSDLQLFNGEGDLLYSRVEYDSAKTRIRDAEYLGNQIVLIDGETLKIINKKHKVVRTQKLDIMANEFDVYNGRIYCATKGKGVLVFDSELNLVQTIDKRNGLLSNFVFELYFKNNEMWACTGGGLTRFTKFEGRNTIKQSINAKNGLTEEEVFDIEFIGDTVFLGTHQGVFFFRLSDWDKILRTRAPLKFQLTDLLMNGTSRPSLFNLSYNENDIEVKYDIISYIQKDGLTFRYKLIGFDEDWRETSDRSVVYKSLPPGEYEIVIQPMFNGVPRKESIREKISISAAYYSSWWFILSVIVGIVVATWLFFRYRILEYNRSLIREILRYLMHRLKPKSNTFVVRSNGKDVKIDSNDILYVESKGNYLDIHTLNSKVTIREKISKFQDLVPDKLEFIRVRRSVIVRKDKITSKNSEVVIVGEKEIRFGSTYKEAVDEIQL